MGGAARSGADPVCALSDGGEGAACRSAVQCSVSVDHPFAGGAGHDGERDGESAGTVVRRTRIGVQCEHARRHEIGADGSGSERKHAWPRTTTQGHRTTGKHAGDDGLPRRELFCTERQHEPAAGRQTAGHLEPRRRTGRLLQTSGHLGSAETVREGRKKEKATGKTGCFFCGEYDS